MIQLNFNTYHFISIVRTYEMIQQEFVKANKIVVVVINAVADQHES